MVAQKPRTFDLPTGILCMAVSTAHERPHDTGKTELGRAVV
jgi:hypothetical protein